MAAEINREEFLGISFSHHLEILQKTKDIQEVLFYIHQTVLHKWDKYDLRNRLKEGLYQKQGAAANNFLQTMPFNDARKAVGMFKDEYLFDNAIKALSFCQMGLMSGERRKSQCGLCHM